MNTTPDDAPPSAHLRSFDQVAREDLRRFDVGIGPWNARSRLAIERRMTHHRCESVLDLGCGPGTFAETLRHRQSPASYCGIDSSPALLALAIERHVDQFAASRPGRREPPRRFERADLAGPLPIAGEQFDAVVVRHVLEHVVPGWGTILETALRAARKVVFVAFSQPLSGRPEAIPTDEYLGLRRWSLPRSAFEGIVAANRFHVDQVVVGFDGPRPEVERNEVLVVLRPLPPITSAPMNDHAADTPQPVGHVGFIPHPQPSPELARAISSGRVDVSPAMTEKIRSMPSSEPPPAAPADVAGD